MPFTLRKKFLDRVVCDYLERSKYEYSLAVFLPEAQIDKDDTLTLNEMCRVADIEDSQLKKLETLKAGFGFLEALLHVYFEFIHCDKFDRGTQTTIDEPLSKKLEQLDKQYASQIDYWRLGGATNF